MMRDAQPSPSLCRRHPEMYALAESVVDRACQRGNRKYAVWFDAGAWHSGDPNGRYYSERSPSAVLAGVYSCRAHPDDIVLDMLAAQDVILEAA